MPILLLAACQPGAPPEPVEECLLDPPAAGEIRVGVLACDEQIPPGGEGRSGADLLIETASFRAVLRHPLDALTVPGVGGATVIDAAPWDGADVLHEAVPLVRGAWLTDLDVTVLRDGVRVEGTAADGERTTVTWRPDGPWLVAEGADGFRLDPRGDVEVLDGLVLASPTVVGAVGAVTDTGVLAVDGTDRLLVSTDRDAWAALAGDDGVRISGEAPGAERLTLLDDGRPVGRVPVEGRFDLVVPATVDHLRADALGHASSPALPVGEGLALPVGGRAVLTLAPSWDDGRTHRLTARTTDPDGRSVTTVLEPEGGALPLGVGVHEIALSAGPAFAPMTLRVELRGDETLGVRLPPRLDPGDHVPIGLARPADRSPEWRGSDLTAVRLAAGEGLAYATFAPRGDVSSTGGATPGLPEIATKDGSTYAGDGWWVASWPWSASPRKALHGAVVIPDLAPAAAAAAMEGGPDDRTLLVDLGWLAAVGPPHRVDPQPELVALTAGDPDAWAPWFTWLDAGRALIPTGPVTWVPVGDPTRVGAVDVERPLLRGDTVAGNGPLLLLTVDGRAPGEVAPRAPDDTGAPVAPAPVRTVTVEVRGDRPEHLALLTEGGRQVPVPEGRSVHALDGRWVLLAGWSDDPAGPWAATGPVWLDPP